MSDKCTELRLKMIKDSSYNKIKLRQLTYAPTLTPVMKIQCAFRYASKDDNNNDFI